MINKCGPSINLTLNSKLLRILYNYKSSLDREAHLLICFQSMAMKLTQIQFGRASDARYAPHIILGAAQTSCIMSLVH